MQQTCGSFDPMFSDRSPITWLLCCFHLLAAKGEVASGDITEAIDKSKQAPFACPCEAKALMYTCPRVVLGTIAVAGGNF